jgi:tRNA U34 5-carboxymethylaminomethyl modifying GTPase MnmE/TrmE
MLPLRPHFLNHCHDPQTLQASTDMLSDLIQESIDSTKEDDSLDGSDADHQEDPVARGFQVISVLNKADLVSPSQLQNAVLASSAARRGDIKETARAGCYPISCATGDGLAELEAAIAKSIKHLLESQSTEGVLITRERHRRHVQQCVEHLDNFLSMELPMDAAAEELRCVETHILFLSLFYFV